jgi:membrane protease YdiL (CAAX protease family)
MEDEEDPEPAGARSSPCGAKPPGEFALGLARSLSIEAAGPPARPLLEAGIVFAALYLTAYIPADAAAVGVSLGKPAFQVLTIAAILPKALLVLYLIARSDGFPAFGLTRPRRGDLARGLLCALGALAVVALPSLALMSLGLRNPLIEAARAPEASLLLVIPLVALSALAVGYGEEIFFRSYLMRRFGQAGLKPAWAALASSLVFGSAHGLQGPLGLALATLLGLWFAWRWLAGGRIHEIALGHAMYDAGVILFALFG